MKVSRGFALVIAAQFLGAVADAALLLVAIQFLEERGSPGWNVPALRAVFYAAYVLMAPFAGSAADAWPKQRVLVATGLVKLAGCVLLLAGAQPVVAYGLVGMGAVAHAPARYGILAELVAQEELVAANAWLEGATVAASLAGVLVGSVLIGPASRIGVRSESVPWNAGAVLACVYLCAAACCAGVRSRSAADPLALRNKRGLVRRFATSVRGMTSIPHARASLLVTSTFWAAAAVLQFVVLRWGTERLNLSLSGAALLQGAFAVGVIAGAAAAGRWIAPHAAPRTLRLGLLVGGGIVLFSCVTQAWIAAALLVAIGLVAGVMLVSMNALLQARAATSSTSGQTIAAQHFIENLASVLMLGLYGAVTALHVPLRPCLVALGGIVSVALSTAWLRTRGQVRPCRGRG